MRATCSTLTALLFSAIFAAAANAVVVTGSFTGLVVDSLDDAIGARFADGQAINGTITFDTALAPSISTGVSAGGWYEYVVPATPWFDVSFTVGGSTTVYTPDLPLSLLAQSRTTNYFGSLSDNFQPEDLAGNDYIEFAVDQVVETTAPFEGSGTFFEISVGSTTVEFIDSLLGLNQSFSLSGR